jgi:hypothetical protein
MAVVSYREVLPRTFSHKFGESPTAEIKVVCTLDGPTNTQAILAAVGIFHGSAHPEYGYLLCHNGQVTETDRFHAEATYSYETPAVGTTNYDPSPLSRRDVWSVSTSGLSVPTFRFYEGSGNNMIKPLINTAGDIIEGAQAIEGELRVSVSGNRAAFPMATAIAVTGCVNSDSYAGAAAHQWLCNGISAQQTTEVVNGAQITYWQVTAELSYKPSGYNLYLPNVGWNYISGSGADGEKKRCFVVDEGGDKVGSANVMALNEDGSIRFNNDFTGSGAPLILERRVNREVSFSQYFGTPPTS